MRASVFGTLLLSILLGSPFRSTSASGTLSAGSTLTAALNARPAAVAEAFTAAENDISAMAYNPSSLRSLRAGHMSFMYEKGYADDALAGFQIGMPVKPFAFGLTMGYYNAGSVDLYDGVDSRSVNAKTDYLLALSAAMPIHSLDIGLTGKVFQSKLAEKYSATAFALDFGAQLPLTNAIRLGASVQNIGSELKYHNEGEALPRNARLGLAYLLSKINSTVFVDSIYALNEQDFYPAVGLESRIGPLALRAGYKGGDTEEQLSFGAGFIFGKASLDYSYGLLEEVDGRHRVSLGMRFGGDNNSSSIPLSKMPSSDMAAGTEMVRFKKGQDVKELPVQAQNFPQTYIVRRKQSLSTVALTAYGDSNMWRKIAEANAHLKGRTELEAGERLVLP